MRASALLPASQVLVRHTQALRGEGTLLLLEPPGDGVVAALADLIDRPMRLFNQRWSAHRAHLAQAQPGADARFGALYDGPQVAGAVVFVPREKRLMEWQLTSAAAALAPGGQLWAVGENRAGARAAGPVLERLCDDAAKIDAARRCSLFRGVCRRPPALPALNDHLAWFPVRLAGSPRPVAALPGVFSAARLDPGTALLIDHLPQVRGRVLDFGCGCGVIALAAALSDVGNEVTAIDDSALALAATEATLTRNGVAPRAVLPSDGFSEIPDGARFDWIISNPPFHQGHRTDYAVSSRLVDEAPAYLSPGGSLLVVANRFLDYRRRMARRFGTVETIAEDHAYRVCRARRKD